MRSHTDTTLLRAIKAEQRPARNGEKSAATRLIAAGLVEAFGEPVRGTKRRPDRRLRLTPRGEVEFAKLPRPRSLMLPGDGARHDCIYAALCIGAFAAAYPTTDEAHCPEKCPHRKDVERLHAPGAI